MTTTEVVCVAGAAVVGTMLGAVLVVDAQWRRIRRLHRRHLRDTNEVEAWRQYAKDISKECMGLAVQVMHARTIAARALQSEAEACRLADSLAGFDNKEGA